MYVPFDQLPDTSRIWIYQAERKLTDDEANFVSYASANFLKNWQAHGQDLKSSFLLEYNQFLIISVDEERQQASGCSIDASVHLIQKIEQELQLSFSTNGLVAFLIEDEVRLKPFNTIKSAIKDNEISSDTLMFDNTVPLLSDFKTKWQVRSCDAWVSRYF